MLAPQGEVRERRCTPGGGPEGQPGSLWAMLSQRSPQKGRVLEEGTEVSMGLDNCHADLGSPSSLTGPFWSFPLSASFLLQPWRCGGGGGGQSKWGRESEGEETAPQLPVPELSWGKR